MANPGPASSGIASTVYAVGNIGKVLVGSFSLSPVAVAANTTAEQVFILPAGTGVLAGDYVSVNKPSAQAGLGIVGSRAVGTDQIAITFSNNTAGAITPTAAESYVVKIERIAFAQAAFPY